MNEQEYLALAEAADQLEKDGHHDLSVKIFAISQAVWAKVPQASTAKLPGFIEASDNVWDDES